MAFGVALPDLIGESTGHLGSETPREKIVIPDLIRDPLKRTSARALAAGQWTPDQAHYCPVKASK
jgi:hypothetical protein